MAKFDAYSRFDIKKDVNFYWYVENYFEENLDRNENIKVDDVNYKDWLTINGFYGEGSDYFDYYFYFAGSRITGSALNNTVSGTVNFLAENWMTEAGVLNYWYSLSGMSLSAKTILDAARSRSTTDDLALFSTSLKGNDTIELSNFDDRMNGFAGNDTMTGNNGHDTLYGDSGRDVLIGGGSKDSLYGGADSDTFRFVAISDMTMSASTTDTIHDFRLGFDKIDLSAIDASDVFGGNNRFTFDGRTAHGASQDGDIYFLQVDKADTSNDYTIVFIDNDSDTASEASIKVMGLHNFTASDFVL